MTNLFYWMLSKAINHAAVICLKIFIVLLLSIYYVENQCEPQEICARPEFINFHLIKVMDPIKEPLAIGATEKAATHKQQWMNIRCDISTNGSGSLLLSHHSIKCAWYLLKQIPFPWLPSTEVFSSISLCCLFISKGWRIWTLWKVNFWIPRVAHWSESTTELWKGY